MKPPSPSLVLCTHNPRADFLERVIESCRTQNAAIGELIVVDSASTPPVSYPGVDPVRSDLPGLARARIAGIQQSKGDPIVFVDDDTVLRDNYVSESIRILEERPYLGAIGGQLIPEYEGPLPLEESYYRKYLAIREFSEASWSNRWDDFATSPIGGGMVVRRAVALAWAERARTSAWRAGLGRTGNVLSGGEDMDLVQICCELGYGKGIFPELVLTHLMPAGRLAPDFLVRIYEGNCRSGAFLSSMLKPQFAMPPQRLRYRLKIALEAATMKPFPRKLFLAGERGKWAGLKQAAEERQKLPAPSAAA